MVVNFSNYYILKCYYKFRTSLSEWMCHVIQVGGDIWDNGEGHDIKGKTFFPISSFKFRFAGSDI